MLVKGKTSHRKECYLCGGTEFNIRPGSVRDNLELEVFECASCGLVFLSSFDHIKDDFYENSEMHGKDALDIQAWIRETEWDDERHPGNVNHIRYLQYLPGSDAEGADILADHIPNLHLELIQNLD